MVVESRSVIGNAKNARGLRRDRAAEPLSPIFPAATAPFPRSCASYFRFARFNTFPLYYLRACHRLLSTSCYRLVLREIQGTIILRRHSTDGCNLLWQTNYFELLLQYGADASLKNNLDNCLLHGAAQGGDTTIINKMLRLGLDVDSRNNAGATSLMKVVYSSKEIAFQQLIQNGADPYLKDNSGYSLLHNALQGGNVTTETVYSTLLHKVEIHPLSTSCYHLVLKMIQGTMLVRLH